MRIPVEVEIPDKQYDALFALAEKRGLKGISELLDEIIEYYLATSSEWKMMSEEPNLPL